jgi:hypothetical protein
LGAQPDGGAVVLGGGGGGLAVGGGGGGLKNVNKIFLTKEPNILGNGKRHV